MGSYKDSARGPKYPSPSFPRWFTIYKIIVQYQNKEIDIAIMCVYFYVTYFTSVNLCNHHCNEDAELFYHHKQLPRVTLLELPSIFHHCYVRAYICQSCFIFPFFPPFTFHCLVFLAFLWITWTLFTTPFWLICRIFKSIYLNSF